MPPRKKGYSNHLSDPHKSERKNPVLYTSTYAYSMGSLHLTFTIYVSNFSQFSGSSRGQVATLSSNKTAKFKRVLFKSISQGNPKGTYANCFILLCPGIKLNLFLIL